MATSRWGGPAALGWHIGGPYKQSRQAPPRTMRPASGGSAPARVRSAHVRPTRQPAEVSATFGRIEGGAGAGECGAVDPGSRVGGPPAGRAPRRIAPRISAAV